LGEPVVPNGLALCSLHHGAFDANILCVTPDFRIEIRDDVLRERDGPMLIHGLQTFHGATIELPSRRSAWPRREFLEERYASFRRGA
jgi:putative restriction endonuclease